MKSKIKAFISSYWLILIIITQPILDIIAFFSFKEVLTPITFIVRSIYLIFIVIYSYRKTKNKKDMLLCTIPFFIFSVLHIANSYRLSGIHIFDDVRYLVMVMQMPIVAISLIFYVKDNVNQIHKIEKGIVVAFFIIVSSTVLSVLTKSYQNTYEDYGITGWFSSANTQSMIISIIVPICMYYFSKKQNYVYHIGVLLSFIILYFNGTRACYYTLISTLILFTYLLLINKRGKSKIAVTVICLILSITLYNISFTFTRSMSIEQNIQENRQKIVKLEDAKTREQKIAILKDNYLYAEMIEDLGEDKVYEEMKDIITEENLSDNRLVKRIYGKIIFNDSDFITKLVGFNHEEIQKYGRDLENDITAIFYYYGYLGFALLMMFILYFAIMSFKLLKVNPFMLKSSKYMVLTYTILLGLLGGEYSGALLRKTNANIYFSLAIVLYYIYINKKMKPKIVKENKVTFLLLHLGYGGIETATINTANALCDKYDVELISFYNLSNNQDNKIDKRITVKHLYNGGPNREEFIKALNDHKYFKVLKEGIKSVDILIKKKIYVIKSIIDCNSKFIISTRWDFSLLLNRFGSKENIKIAQEHHYHNNDKKYINKLKKYQNIDYLFALTKTLEHDYKKILKNNNHTKVVLVPNMITEIPNKESSLNKKNIITISRLDPGKKNDDIIKAFSKLNEKDWKLYIIGDGVEYNNLVKLIKELDLEDRVILTGYKNKKEIEEYLLKSSIFLMASITEGLPMVLLEAMSYGVPCIAYETASGTSDIIKDNINGYIIKNRNEEEYINKIEKLISNKKLRNTLGNNAKKTVDNFSKDEILKIWYKILK